MTKNNHKIIVLDDDPDIGTMIKVMLEFRGYTVFVTERVEQLRQVIGEQPISLVITDMLLSGDNGTDVCIDLKKDPATSHIPVIIFSAHPNARQSCLGAGADDFLAKPFDMQELYKKVDSLVLEKNVPN